MFLFIIHPITCKTRSTDSIFLFLFCVHILVLNMVCAKRIRQICIRADSRTDILWFSKMTKCIKSVFYCLPVVPDIPLSAAHSIPLAVECCFVCVQRLNFPSKTKVSILRSACNFLFVCVCCLKRETNYPPFLPYLNSSSFFSVPQHQHPPTKKKAKTFCEKWKVAKSNSTRNTHNCGECAHLVVRKHHRTFLRNNRTDSPEKGRERANRKKKQRRGDTFRCKFSGGQKAKFGFAVFPKLGTLQLVAFILTN